MLTSDRTFKNLLLINVVGAVFYFWLSLKLWIIRWIWPKEPRRVVCDHFKPILVIDLRQSVVKFVEICTCHVFCRKWATQVFIPQNIYDFKALPKYANKICLSNLRSHLLDYKWNFPVPTVFVLLIIFLTC